MGVPKFFRYMSERYPCLSELVKDHQVRNETDPSVADNPCVIDLCVFSLIFSIDPGVRQPVSGHERYHTQLFASERRRSAFPHIRRDDFQKHLPLLRGSNDHTFTPRQVQWVVYFFLQLKTVLVFNEP